MTILSPGEAYTALGQLCCTWSSSGAADTWHACVHTQINGYVCSAQQTVWQKANGNSRYMACLYTHTHTYTHTHRLMSMCVQHSMLCGRRHMETADTWHACTHTHTHTENNGYVCSAQHAVWQKANGNSRYMACLHTHTHTHTHTHKHTHTQNNGSLCKTNILWPDWALGGHKTHTAHTCKHTHAHTYTHTHSHTYSLILRCRYALAGWGSCGTHNTQHIPNTYEHTHANTYIHTHSLTLRCRHVLAGWDPDTQHTAHTKYVRAHTCAHIHPHPFTHIQPHLAVPACFGRMGLLGDTKHSTYVRAHTCKHIRPQAQPHLAVPAYFGRMGLLGGIRRTASNSFFTMLISTLKAT